ncbi:uncharacterized protein LOC120290160 [Eucalyptus grandis]|uniref:uncharacterized protein LOC120290160 n=1 Tax=Eucalyptus grandis TaxID=71139 RepID=UPI00192ED4E4|nr:uncharacterized protein LOC120290160 [Eucalyptus grandis]
MESNQVGRSSLAAQGVERRLYGAATGESETWVATGGSAAGRTEAWLFVVLGVAVGRRRRAETRVAATSATEQVLHKERRFGDIYNRNYSNNYEMECNKNFNARDNESAADANCAPASSRPIKPSFWTQCSACHVKFEYLICYSNKRLRCRNSNCRKTFVAIEIAPPPMEGNGSSPSKAFFEAQPFPNRMRNYVYALVGRQTSPTNAGSTSFSGIHLPEKLASSDGTSIKFVSDKGAPAPASSSPPSGVLEPIVRHRKRDREEAATTVKERCSGMIQRLKAGSGSVGMSSNVNSLENEGIKKSQVGEGGMNKKVTEDASPAAFANAKKEIFQKINEWSNGKVKEGYGEEQKAPPNGAKTIAVKHKKPVDGKDKVHLKKPSPAISNVETEAENFVFKQMLIAPDFHDFDNDRTEVSFANNQVWAVYDDDDGMPCYYALIHNVITLKPFKVCISWLGSNSNQELGSIPWVKSGFAKTCGDLQGDVWALYSNWTNNWNESTPNEVKHSYDLVEVIEDNNEDRGITVAPLTKVKKVRMLILDAVSLILHPQGPVDTINEHLSVYTGKSEGKELTKMGKLMENKWMPR